MPRTRPGYDRATSGCGSAAFAAAIAARTRGARVVMIERGATGGAENITTRTSAHSPTLPVAG